MRNGIFLSALLATVMFGGTALAENYGDNTDKRSTRGHSIKEQVLEKMKEGFGKQNHSSAASRRDLKQDSVTNRSRPRGEVYGDQATRSTKARSTTFGGRNSSASGRVNTPSEVRAMLKMINPLAGAYRTSQAAEGTDSYGGNLMSRIPNGKNGGKNMSASGRVNTPSEIKAMLQVINPMRGAYRTSQAAEGADSYGGESKVKAPNADRTKNNVHFKNDRGEVINTTQGNTATAMKNRQMRDQMIGMIKAKMAAKAGMAGK
jgi:hypothetical protein